MSFGILNFPTCYLCQMGINSIRFQSHGILMPYGIACLFETCVELKTRVISQMTPWNSCSAQTYGKFDNLYPRILEWAIQCEETPRQ